MKQKLSFSVEFVKHRWPVIAIGFIGGTWREFVVCLWLVDFRITWGY